MRPLIKFSYLFCATLIAPVVMSAEVSRESRCHTEFPKISSKLVPSDKMQVSAKKLEVSANKIYSLNGDVEITTAQQVLKTDIAEFNDQTKDLKAKGNIHYQQQDLNVTGDAISLNIRSEEGEAVNTEYRIATTNANGNAGRIAFQSQQLELDNADYSTCPPEQKAWQISAEKITLDHKENEGIARNAKIEIFSVPVFYLPYISFPLQGRKSGILAPTPAYSSTDGLDLLVPYYFNIAPNYDMTLSPRYIQKRGAQFGSEFRYLQQNLQGEIGLEILPDDKQIRDDRYLFHVRQHNYLGPDTWLSTTADHVSDANYFSDLGTTLNSASRSQLNRQIYLQTQGQQWYFSGVFQDYQMLNAISEPYRRLPQLALFTEHSYAGISTQLFSQYSHFYKKTDDNIQRFIVNPALSLPWHKPYGYVIPTIGVYAQAYQAKNSARESQHHEYFHTSARLFFDRTSSFGLQTLSPRFAYLYMPQQTQDNLPLIDGAALIPSYEDLFFSRRYSGWDRFGDIHRISWGLENSWSSTTGRPLLAINLAQARILKSQMRHFSNDLVFQEGDNLYASAFKAYMSKKIQLDGDILTVNKLDRFDYASLAARYRHNLSDQVELRHDFRSNLLQQTSLILTKTLSSQWRIATRWAYSNKYKQIREGLFGLEYNNCCWSVRLVARRFASVIDAEGKNSVALQFELKGLTAIGSKLEETFSQEIFGIQ